MITLTNLNAMRSAAAMAESNADIKTSMERLSTGSRINSASDDAAGLAISVRMDTQILGLAKAIANGADAIGLLSTADGALGEVSSLLQRMRELSLQSATGSVTAADRTYLNNEYQRLKNEIDRIGSQTQWNGMNIFDGVSFPDSTKFQVGANAGQTISVKIEKLSSRDIGKATDPITWVQMGDTLHPEASDDHVTSVSLSSDGSIMAIGARHNDGNGMSSGHVRIYKYEDDLTGWTQIGGDIDGEAAGDVSGNSVSLSADGSILAIGAPKNDAGGNNSGHTRIFSYDNSTGAWVQLGSDIDGEAAEDYAGLAVSLSSDGKTVAIGAPYNSVNGASSGHARVYRYDSDSGDWLKLGSDIDGASGDKFGRDLSLSADGKTVVVGAPENDGTNSRSGTARVYRYDEVASNWVQLGTDLDGEAVDDLAGASVSISADGSRVVIGAAFNDGVGTSSGHARLYEFDSDSNSWIQIGADIDADSNGAQFGFDVSLSADGTSVAISALNASGYPDGRGFARIYDFNTDSSQWEQVGEDIRGLEALDYSLTLSLSDDGEELAFIADAASYTRVFARHDLSVSTLATGDNAELAIGSIDVALTEVSAMSASYGATMNRVEYAIENLTNGLLSTEASKSRIADADYAKESSNLASAQIRNQGAKAMLAQANTDQQLTLSLLEDWL
ncbi:MAG: flagellin [Luminiphilus sp.]|nr:flagellin [Luminiphilus sp.]